MGIKFQAPCAGKKLSERRSDVVCPADSSIKSDDSTNTNSANPGHFYLPVPKTAKLGHNENRIKLPRVTHVSAILPIANTEIRVHIYTGKDCHTSTNMSATTRKG